MDHPLAQALAVHLTALRIAAGTACPPGTNCVAYDFGRSGYGPILLIAAVLALAVYAVRRRRAARSS